MGLLTRIFGNGEDKSEGQADDDAEGSGIREADIRDRAQPLPEDATASGTRNSLSIAPGRGRDETRANSSSRKRQRVRRESTRGPPMGVSNDSPVRTALVVSPTSLTPTQLHIRAGGRLPVPVALGHGAALDGLAPPEDATYTSTPSTPTMSTDADHDVSDVGNTKVSDASEEFEVSEEELEAWEDLITSDEVVASEDASPESSHQNPEPERMTMPTEPSKTPKQTLVENGTEFKGTLKSSCPVVVNGTIDGEVDAPEITIARSGAVLGAIKAKKLRSQGTLSGNVDAGDVFLAGVVRSKTIIKARSLEVKLGSSDKGQLEVTFGECNLELGEAPAEQDVAGLAPSSAELSTTGAEPAMADGWATLEGSESSAKSNPAVSPAPSGRSTWKSSRMS